MSLRLRIKTLIRLGTSMMGKPIVLFFFFTVVRIIVGVDSIF